MTDLKKFVENNKQIIVILYIILLIILLLLHIDEMKFGKILKLKESFQNRSNQSIPSPTSATPSPTAESTEPDTGNILVHNLLIWAIDNDKENDDLPIRDKYFGSFISQVGSQNSNNNFVYTNSLASDRWMTPENSELSPKHICIDLTYDNYRRLMAIGMTIENGKPVYDIFKKYSNDFRSNWTKINSNRKMRSLCYDLKYGKLMGCNSYDGQIYESKYRSLSYGNWIGPINYDVPMKKVMYDKEGYLIGIGLIDSFMYRKKTINWRNSKWDKKNINKTKVYDLIYDTDGCFIASTPEGIKKQLYPDFNSEFVNYADFNQEHTNILSHDEILQYKVGFEFLDDDFDTSTELGRDLKRIYEFKKISNDLCKTKSMSKPKSDNINPDQEDINSNTISRQNEEINDLYSQIYSLTNKMDI